GAITQFFFEAHEFLRFRDLCAKAGIDKPIIPGILPFRRAASLERLAQISGMEIPAWLISGLRNAAIAGCEDLFAVSTAADTIKGLQREGVTQVHLYTMNDHAVIRELCDMFVAPGLTERQKKTSAA
ncbi:MAG: methylenetetrahydrofolate reductase, partial [Pseudomonadota bacterium]